MGKINDFVYKNTNVPRRNKEMVEASFSKVVGEWNEDRYMRQHHPDWEKTTESRLGFQKVEPSGMQKAQAVGSKGTVMSAKVAERGGKMFEQAPMLKINRKTEWKAPEEGQQPAPSPKPKKPRKTTPTPGPKPQAPLGPGPHGTTTPTFLPPGGPPKPPGPSPQNIDPVPAEFSHADEPVKPGGANPAKAPGPGFSDPGAGTEPAENRRRKKANPRRDVPRFSDADRPQPTKAPERPPRRKQQEQQGSRTAEFSEAHPNTPQVPGGPPQGSTSALFSSGPSGEGRPEVTPAGHRRTPEAPGPGGARRPVPARGTHG